MLKFMIDNILTSVAFGAWGKLCLGAHGWGIHHLFLLLHCKLSFKFVVRLCHWKHHILRIDHHVARMSAVCCSRTLITDLLLLKFVKLTHHVVSCYFFFIAEKVLILIISTLIFIDSRNLALSSLLNINDSGKRGSVTIVLLNSTLRSIICICITHGGVCQASYRSAVFYRII